MQADFVKIELSSVFIPSGKSIIQPILQAKKKFIERKLTVINIITIHGRDKSELGVKDIELSRDYCIADTAGAAIIDELLPSAGEITVSKKFYSGFFNTDLRKILETKKISNLFFTKLTTSCCVSSTARDAYNYKYNLYFIEECLTATSKTAHKYELMFFKKSLGTVISLDDLDKYLE